MNRTFTLWTSERLLKLGIEPDMVDITALYDSSLTLRENMALFRKMYPSAQTAHREDRKRVKVNNREQAMEYMRKLNNDSLSNR
jgi:hypothetical protein